MKRVVAALVLASAASAAMAAAESPQDFAYGAPIATSEEATAYRFALPLEAYRGSARADLADLRVFNAQGEVVPYSLRHHDAKAATLGPGRPLALFPLRADSHLVIDGVRVTIDSADTSVNLQTQGGRVSGAAANPAVDQYLIDGRALDAPVAAFDLDWPETPAQYSGRVRLEASDDLGTWRTVIGAAPIANLRANDRELIERRIELPATRSKFWRLVWLGAAPPFELRAVLAQSADSPPQDRSELEVAGQADPQKPATYLFDLGAHLPIDRVSLALPELNTVMAVDLESRADPQAPWRRVSSGGVYRLKTASGEQSNAPVSITVDRDRYWRALFGAADTSRGPIKLQVFYVPSEVVFLARGSGPYELAYGNPQAARAEADLESLPASLPIAAATLGSQQLLGGAGRLKGPPTPFPLKRTVLWIVLILGVGMLSVMAYRLAKEFGGKVP